MAELIAYTVIVVMIFDVVFLEAGGLGGIFGS